MANDISNFFNSETDRNLAAEAVKEHLKRSWDPRMRREIIAYAQQGGSELSELARMAIARLQG
jgi:formate dehydrogenase subunit delta